MATVQAYNSWFAFEYISTHRIPYDGNTFVREANVFGARYFDADSIIHKGFDLFHGSFTYGDKIGPSAGTISAYERSFSGGRMDFKISGLNIDAKVMVQAIASETKADDLALFKAAFAGDDVLIGAKFSDKLQGLDGNDILIGRGGRDTLAGGSGNDVFVFEKNAHSTLDIRDTIKDFRRGFDKIDLRKIDADQDGTAGNQAFKFIGSKAFTGRDGELRFSGGNLYGDVNGDGVADLAVKLTGVKALSASDFFL
ncbi:MAG TPA: M10 family metallopeptidase C-terminal domain-containing protein [Microvirga sp.]|jgi:Ca2+-binding RTX toxin-like protein